VWSSAAATGDGTVGSSGGFGPPAVLTADAVVIRVIEPDGIVSAADGQSVEVQVPRTRIARMLQAIANGDALAVVPAGIPLASR
jgi:2-phospho-L-lactate guanylyltransferase (CobY/MobA/RfbA family)